MSLPKFSLTDKVAIVTGARRGICREIALCFAEAGANVVVVDVVDGGELTGVAKEIKKLGRRSLAVRMDISRKVEVENMVKQTMKEFGTIDILLNGAAATKFIPLMDMEEADWDMFLDVDLKGYFLCAQAVGRIMMAQKRGNIISIASTSSFKPLSNRGAYSIAKAGVVMLTELLALDLAKYNIRVNAFAPAMVRTEFARPIWEDPEALKIQEGKTPLGRIAEPADMVGAALFLASDASSFVTGHILLVDGGFTLK